VPGATGYIIRFGNERDKLHQSIMVYGKNEISMNFMNKGVNYYFTIDAFNENGVTKNDKILELPTTGSYKQ
jgi:xylan 1,4-beta-xylosidase